MSDPGDRIARWRARRDAAGAGETPEQPTTSSQTGAGAGLDTFEDIGALFSDERFDAEAMARAIPLATSRSDLADEGGLADIARRAEALAHQPPEEYRAMLSALIAGLASVKHGGLAERRSVFGALATGLERGAERHDGTAGAIEVRRRQLRLLIRLVETDLREGKDVFAAGYEPDMLEQRVTPIIEAYQVRRQRQEQAAQRTADRQGMIELRMRSEAGGASAPDLSHVVASGAGLAQGAIENARAICAAILTPLQALPVQTVPARRAVYDALALGLERGLESEGLEGEVAELRHRQLRTVVRQIEGDIRAGRDVFAPDYSLQTIDDAVHLLVVGFERRRQQEQAELARAARRQALLANEALSIGVNPEEEGDLDHLRELLTMLDATRGRDSGDCGRMTVRAMLALWRYQFVLLKSESRIALVWMLLGPAVLLGLISSVYLLSGARAILDMDVATFAMIGATTWIMFRNVIFRSSTAFHAQRWLLNLRAFSPVTVGVAQGSIYIVVYAIVFTVLISAGHLVGLFTLPDDILRFAFWFVCMGLAALCVGTIFGCIAVIWPYFLRFAPAIERGLQIVSSVFYVSEQLPVTYRQWILLSPFAHILQLLRSAYFVNYESTDANPEYFFLCFGLLAVTAFVGQRLVSWRPQPA